MKKALVLFMSACSLAMAAQTEFRSFKRKDIYKANAQFYDLNGMFRMDLQIRDPYTKDTTHYDILYVFKKSATNHNQLEMYELFNNSLALMRFKNDTTSIRHYFRDTWQVREIYKFNLRFLLYFLEVPPSFSNVTFFPLPRTIYNWGIPRKLHTKKTDQWYQFEIEKDGWLATLYLDSQGVVHKYKERGLKAAEAGEGVVWDLSFQKIYNITLEKFADSVFDIKNAFREIDKQKKKRAIKDSALKVITKELKSGLELPIFNCSENKMISPDSFNYILAESWYIQCQPCYMMKKDLEANAKGFIDRKIKVLGYNTINDTGIIRGFLCNKGYGGDEINTKVFRAELLNPSSYPTIYLLDRDLKIVKTFVGYDKNTVKEILEYVDEIATNR